jgi:surfeit locus 1 family protein
LSQAAYLALQTLDRAPQTGDLRGKWFKQETIYLDNRAMNSQAGFWVMTPLVLGEERSVLVQRGWIPEMQTFAPRLQPFETPSTEIEIEAQISQGPSKMFDLAEDKPLQFNTLDEARSLRIRQNVELKAFAKERALHLIGNVIEVGPSSQGLRRDWPVPAARPIKMSAIRCSGLRMSLLLAILYIWYQIIKPKRDAKKKPPKKRLNNPCP